MDIDLDKILKRAGVTISVLDSKKEQTTKKIEYVTKYVQEWIRVGCMSESIHTLSFIDGMANAGIYDDGSLGTATQVYAQFIEAAKSFPLKTFNLIFNDLNPVRVQVFKQVCAEIFNEKREGQPLSNLFLYFSNSDINEFIRHLPEHDSMLIGYGRLTLLFIDPYDARTVDGPLLHDYLGGRYCELFYNWFSSDHVRNPDDDAIRSCFSGIEVPSGYDAASFIAEYLSGPEKAHFSFPFRNQNNTELYQIIFITPNLRGLEKVKEALWSTFAGAEYHRNKRGSCYQTTMFDLAEGQEIRKGWYGSIVQEQIAAELEARNYSYAEIELFVLQRSMLAARDVIDYVIKPMIAQGALEKNNNVNRKNNYKGDTYHLVKRCGDERLQQDN